MNGLILNQKLPYRLAFKSLSVVFELLWKKWLEMDPEKILSTNNNTKTLSFTGGLNKIWMDLLDALSVMPAWERAVHLFWLLGPFILLIERSPADAWLTLLALAFLLHSIFKRDFSWLSVFWVQACFMFLTCCLVSSIMSVMKSYAILESLMWFRFPIFLMATVFWFGRDRRLIYAMLISTAIGMLIMTGILTLEMLFEGQKAGRLYWPYGDPVPGNYLSKVGLPAFIVMVALAIGAAQNWLH